MSSPGSINWGNNSPQSYIFCGRCDDHFMLCSCKDVGYGIDYIFKKLPPPSPNSTQLMLLRRFSDLVSVSPSMRQFAAHMWVRNEAADLIASMNREQTQGQLRQMMEEYLEMFAAKPVDLSLTDFATIIGGPSPLAQKPSSVQIKMIAKEGRAA
eukprot:scaffold7420_cov75-Skeletonema_menzelii.AAC.1